MQITKIFKTVKKYWVIEEEINKLISEGNTIISISISSHNSTINTETYWAIVLYEDNLN